MIQGGKRFRITLLSALHQFKSVADDGSGWLISQVPASPEVSWFTALSPEIGIGPRESISTRILGKNSATSEDRESGETLSPEATSAADLGP